MNEARKMILCIEDDHETASLIAEELIDRGFRAEIARDGAEGLRAIFTKQPSLVLSDILMPTMSGFEVLERLAAFRPQLEMMPFIFLTAFADGDNEIKALELGADYLTKPIDFDLLEIVIRARLLGVANRMVNDDPGTRRISPPACPTAPSSMLSLPRHAQV